MFSCSVPALQGGRAWDLTEFVWVLENLESPGILFWHFLGLESRRKSSLVLEVLEIC